MEKKEKKGGNITETFEIFFIYYIHIHKLQNYISYCQFN